VTVRSVSAMPLQFIDYGRNRRNVEKLAGLLSARLVPGPAAAGRHATVLAAVGYF
jgi:hypothetical protein